LDKNQIKFSSDFNPNLIGSNIDEYLKKIERQFSDIKKGVEKKVIWAEKK
jgi:hypothetical protein